MQARYVAGIINHGSYDDVERCLASLRRQTLAPAAVIVTDTGVDPGRFDALARAHPDVACERIANRGWAGGVNHVVDRAAALQPDAGYLLLLNPDVELDPTFAETLVGSLAGAPSVAIASGKLLRPGRATLDSAGIRLPRHRRPRDRGSGEPDAGQYDRAERVFAVSGAAMLARCAALEDLRIDGEVVDEDFFAYHDDTDLCWRANLFGWQVLYEPAAQAVHGRRWQREQRMQIAPRVRRHSFKNHYLQLIKNERGRDLLRNLPWLVAWEGLRLGFALLRDRAVLPAYADAWRAAPRAFRRRREIQRRARERGARRSLRPWIS